MIERYYAIRIGRNEKIDRDKERAYFAADDATNMPALFETLKQAREQRRKILGYCGHKDVYVVKVELMESK